MKKKITRALALIMALAMCVTLFAGCGKKAAQYESYLSYYEDGTATSEGVSDADATASKSNSTKKTSGKKVSTYKTTKNSTNTVGGGTVTDKALKGYKFVISSPWMAKSKKDSQMEQEKSFYNAAEKLMKETGCKISVIAGIGSTQQNSAADLKDAHMSGSKYADAVDVMATSVLSLAAAGYIVPWSDVKDIDPNSKYFVKGYTKLATVDGKGYGLSFLRAPEARMCVVVNQTALSESGIDANGIYTLVKNKQWTWDVFRDYAIRVTNAHKTGGSVSVYGMGGDYNKVAQAIYSSYGARIVNVSNGVASLGYKSQAMKDALGFMNKLFNEDKVYPTGDVGTAAGEHDTSFKAGKLGLYIQETYFVSKYLKTSNPSFSYGIAPVPLAPGKSEYVSAANNARVWVLPVNTAFVQKGKSREASETIGKTITIINKLAQEIACPTGSYEGESWWQYDLKKEYFQNDTANNDLEMYMICLDNSISDPGYSGSIRNSFDSAIKDAILNNTGSVAAKLDALPAHTSDLKALSINK